MSKKEFLNTLKNGLKGLPQKEQEKTLTYYDEIIEDYKEEGMSEEEAVLKLGSAEEIADEILGESKILPKKNIGIGSTILLILGFPLWGSLLLAVILFLISFYILIWTPIIATGGLAIGFLMIALVGIIGSPFIMLTTFSLGILQLGIGIVSLGLFIFASILTICLVKYILLATGFLTRKITGLFKKKKEIFL